MVSIKRSDSHETQMLGVSVSGNVKASAQHHLSLLLFFFFRLKIPNTLKMFMLCKPCSKHKKKCFASIYVALTNGLTDGCLATQCSHLLTHFNRKRRIEDKQREPYKHGVISFNYYYITIAHKCINLLYIRVVFFIFNLTIGYKHKPHNRV